AGKLDQLLARADTVADASEEISNRISHRHIRYFLFAYQLLLMTPGISPRNASSRKQRRHISNLRRYARERPQRLQRLFTRTLTLCFLGSLSINLLMLQLQWRARADGTACRAA